ncbi:MAG: hypothetical protein E7264_00045 [Lachnospiraceae bacterium]|nr:hypothetical protein [Lachnospiraceae bacterium]
MNKRAAGVIFICVAAFLYAARYIAAAIYMSGTLNWDAELFSQGLEYVGSPLLILSIISLIIGCVYLFFAETAHLDDEVEQKKEESEK